MSEKDKSGLDGYALAAFIGAGLGAILTLHFTQPQELKAQIIQNQTALDSCKAALNESETTIKGMLMNR